MKTSLSLILAAAAAALLSSCYVVPDKPSQPTRAQLEQQKKEAEELAKKEAEAKKKQEQQAQKKKADDAIAKTDEESTEKREDTAEKPAGDDLPKPRQPGGQDSKPSYPVAKKAPGKEGFVLSPYNKKLVDVRGIASGKLVRDPTYDPAEKKLFRVP